MKINDKSKAGMGDPYWYEWSVGLEYIIDMLNPDNHIKCVALQANVSLGLDDVVVTYNDGKIRFIQVKHTRVEDTLSFGNLVSCELDGEGNKKKLSLLGELAKSWNEEIQKYSNAEVYIFTNRKAGNRVALAGPDRSIKRPKLKPFLTELQKEINLGKTYNELDFQEWNNAWKEWCDELECIDNDEKRLLFLKNLYIETEKGDLDSLEIQLKEKLKRYLVVNDTAANSLLIKLKGALSIWTTSRREKAEIDIEDVYSALSITEDIVQYNHDLVPVNPFFDSRLIFINELESELKNGASKVLFLSGAPGIGKTNIISKLSGKKDSIITLRYYAYEPIDPSKEYFAGDVSARVNKDVFWNTLLNQLRSILDGNLYKYNVPVTNSFLTIEQKRKEFLRIASEYAVDKKSNFILAIDGIDHAARAGIIENTFLPTIPNPEYIPDNIKIVIAGQPKEVYKNYPEWIYQESSLVKEYIVPQIKPEDIEKLVKEKCKKFSLAEHTLITKIISEYAGGNTLAAIFAVHEATLCDNVANFEQRLIDRKLSGNIQEYYRSIWENAKKNMSIPFVEYKMAGVFAFFNEPINAEKLRKIFPEEQYSVSVWNNVLKSLSPLLIKENDDFIVLHNDVRVYLSGVIGKDQENVQEVYSHLADYYINLPEKNLGYYHDVIRFLIAAGRIHEFDKVFSPEFIIEAYVLGIDLFELKETCNHFLDYLSTSVMFDWCKFRNLALDYLTIDQIEKSGYEIENACFRNKKKNIAVHEYECYTPPFSKWSKSILNEVFCLIISLYENDEEKRGEALFHNWFDDVIFSDIQNIIEGVHEDEYIKYNAKSFLENLGTVCVLNNSYNLLSCGRENDNNKYLREIVAIVENKAFEYLGNIDLRKALEALPFLYFNPLIKGIKLLIESNRHDDLLVLKEVLLNRVSVSNPFINLLCTFLEILTESIQLTHEEAKDFYNKFESISIPDNNFETEMSYYSIYAFVLAYLNEERSNEIAEIVAKKYLLANKYKKNNYFVLYFNFIACVGKWYRLKEIKKINLLPIDDICTMIHNLFEKRWHPNDTDYESFELKMYALKGVIKLSKESEELRGLFDKNISKLFDDNPVNQLLDLGMLFYRNDELRMQTWIDCWLSDNGKVWDEPIGERNRIVKAFIDAKKKYDDKNSLSLRNAEERIKWSIIGFSSSKEYTAYALLNLYNQLVEKNDEYIEEYGSKVKDISDKIEMLGDNRGEYLLNCKIYSDFGFAGKNIVKKVLNNKVCLEQCLLEPSYLVEILIGYLRRGESSREELLKIWSLGIGILDWRNEDDYATIRALQRSIELCAEQKGIKSIKNSLAILSPANIDLLVDPVRYVIPERWSDTKNDDIKNDEDARTIVKNYFYNAATETSNYETAKALDYLCNREKLSNEEIISYLNKEVLKNNYSIHHDSVIKVLVENGKQPFIDEWIKEYLKTSLGRNYFYPELELLDLLDWKSKTLDEEFVKDSVDLFIKMNRSWITMNGHIDEPEIKYDIDYSNYFEFSYEDIIDLYFEILLFFIQSEDADAARTALEGIAALIRVDFKYIFMIEDKWNHFHFRAKEWLLMIYEFIYRTSPEARSTLAECLKEHTKDNDFNVAIYSKILCENIDKNFSKQFQIEYKDYFDDIPEYSSKGLIKSTQKKSWINGSDYVVSRIEKMQKYFLADLKDIESRTAEYALKLQINNSLLPLKRQKHGGCKVVCDNTNLAFFRVLYKDWYNGRWKNQDGRIARSIISASEPHVLLLSPMKWKWNNGVFFSNTKKILSSNKTEINNRVFDVLSTGLDANQIVLGGKIEDYTYNQFLIGVTFMYFDIPGINNEFVVYQTEENARLVLKEREDYFEGKHPNITIFQNGVESFIHSNLECGICSTPLDIFGWKIVTKGNQILICNFENLIIGRFEYFYGNRTDIGCRSVIEQPYMQRWVVNKEELEKAIAITGCPYNVSVITDSIIDDVNLR